MRMGGGLYDARWILFLSERVLLDYSGGKRVSGACGGRVEGVRELN